MNKQMFYLFISNFSILCVGFGLFPLLPVYASHFGATPSLIGVYLALTYVSITLGTMLTGWLSGKVSRKLSLGVAGVLGVAALAALGHVTMLWQVVLLTGIVWFTGGVGLAAISILTGLHTDESNRGKWFSLIALTNPLGAIAGGLLVGQLVEWQGYPVMFWAMALEYAIWPLLGLFLIRDRTAPTKAASFSIPAASAQTGRTFHLLLMAILLSAMTISVNRLGLSLLMKSQSYGEGAISTANVVGGVVTIPLVLWFGRLSDRLGRKFFLESGYLLAALGGLTLVIADQTWQFWLVAASTLATRSINGSLAPALATDILRPESLGRRLPWVGAVTWIAGVIGFAGSGVVIDRFGQSALFMIATLLAVGSVAMVGMLPGSRLSFKGWLAGRRLSTPPKTASAEC